MSYFDITKAEKVKRFIEQLTLTKGEMAGRKMSLLPWQWEDVIKPAFGTLREKGGARQYRIVYVEIPKKNGKSPIAAAIGLYMLCADGEASPEVYIAAADREQAGYVYQYAQPMVYEHETLNKRLKVLDSRKRIIYPGNHGFMQVLSAESYTKHGINPSCIIFDELHAQPNDELWNTLTSGTHYARKQQLIVVLTTAGVWDTESIWWRQRERAIKIRDGALEDPTFLPVLYIADRLKDDPNDEEVWKRVNPSLGHIFDIEKVREDFKIAKTDPVAYNNFLRFRLNIPTADLTQAIKPEDWKRCDGVVDEEALKGRTCYAGLDLSATTDLTAFVLLFPPVNDGDKVQILPRFWCPADKLVERGQRDSAPYHVWVQQKYLTATPGGVIDYNYVLEQIRQDSQKFDLRDIVFDRWGSQKLVNDLLAMGFEDEKLEYAQRHLIQFGQGYASMNAPSKELIRMVVAGELNHGCNPVLTWMCSNMVFREDPAGNIKPDKSESADRIDGMVAMIMGLDRYMRMKNTTSVYEERGLISL
jgi:phage terminase large subunit-like protein